MLNWLRFIEGENMKNEIKIDIDEILRLIEFYKRTNIDVRTALEFVIRYQTNTL